MTNRLEEHRDLVAQHGDNHWGFDRRWLGFLDEFAALNGWKRSKSFTIEALARGMPSGGRTRLFQWPGWRHATYYKDGRIPAAMVTEPTDASDVEDLIRYAKHNDLVVHLPPNPLASLYHPGTCHFVTIVPSSAPSPRFLADQIEFETNAKQKPNTIG